MSGSAILPIRVAASPQLQCKRRNLGKSGRAVNGVPAGTHLISSAGIRNRIEPTPWGCLSIRSAQTVLDRFFSRESETVRDYYHASSQRDDDDDGAMIETLGSCEVSSSRDRAWDSH